MNPLRFIAASLASDANLDPTFSRAFQQTAALDRFREPDDAPELDSGGEPIDPSDDCDARLDSLRDEGVWR